MVRTGLHATWNFVKMLGLIFQVCQIDACYLLHLALRVSLGLAGLWRQKKAHVSSGRSWEPPRHQNGDCRPIPWSPPASAGRQSTVWDLRQGHYWRDTVPLCRTLLPFTQGICCLQCWELLWQCLLIYTMDNFHRTRRDQVCWPQNHLVCQRPAPPACICRLWWSVNHISLRIPYLLMSWASNRPMLVMLTQMESWSAKTSPQMLVELTLLKGP